MERCWIVVGYSTGKLIAILVENMSTYTCTATESDLYQIGQAADVERICKNVSILSFGFYCLLLLTFPWESSKMIEHSKQVQLNVVGSSFAIQ